MSSTDDRLTKLEVLVEMHLKKVSEGLDSLSVLMHEAEENNEFKKEFEDKVKTLIETKLSSIGFNNTIKKLIKDEVEIIFNDDKTRKSFDEKVTLLIKKSFKDFYVRATIIFFSAISTLLLAYFQGFFK